MWSSLVSFPLFFVLFPFLLFLFSFLLFFYFSSISLFFLFLQFLFHSSFSSLSSFLSILVPQDCSPGFFLTHSTLASKLFLLAVQGSGALLNSNLEEALYKSL